MFQLPDDLNSEAAMLTGKFIGETGILFKKAVDRDPKLKSMCSDDLNVAFWLFLQYLILSEAPSHR